MVLAERLVVVLSVSGGDPERAARPGELLERLATGWEDHVIGVHISSTGVPLVDALLAGLWGDALDRRTGSVTLASLGEHLARRVPEAALQTSPAIETFTSVPPLGTLAHPPRTRPSTLEPSDPADLVGVVLPGRFRIERPLGQGSFGVIYRARQLSVERDVAVKVLHPGVDPDSDDGRLFVAEIQAVGRIDHANVVRIFQADVTPGGRLFFAMELLLGRDLQQIVDAEAPLETDRAVDLTRQLLAGLAAVHEAGLVHSDIKPANTFVTAAARGGERLVLLDFGVARLRTPAGAESAGGTPAYMAPEQLHQGRVDARIGSLLGRAGAGDPADRVAAARRRPDRAATRWDRRRRVACGAGACAGRRSGRALPDRRGPLGVAAGAAAPRVGGRWPPGRRFATSRRSPSAITPISTGGTATWRRSPSTFSTGAR
jgi:hypothetical protein